MELARNLVRACLLLAVCDVGADCRGNPNLLMLCVLFRPPPPPHSRIASLLAEQSDRRDEKPKPTKTSLFSHRKRLVRQRLQDFCHENKELLVTTTADVNDIIKKIRRVAAPQGHGLVRCY